MVREDSMREVIRHCSGKIPCAVLLRGVAMRQLIVLTAWLSLLLVPLQGVPRAPSSGGLKITRRARSLQPGEIVILEVESPQPLRKLKASAMEHEFPFFTKGDGLKWTGLVGIDLGAQPGRYSVRLSGEDARGAAVVEQYALTVAAKSFPTRKLTVDEKFVSPPASVQARIKAEAERVSGIFNSVAMERYWGGPFHVPVPGPPISEFGKRSVYNGQARSPHAGTDFQGATGTPIVAPNAGVVALAENLYYSGNTVIIDHGLGLFSYFGHMSAFAVHKGDRVSTGQVVGKVGATGLVTGPHLHWSVRLDGTRVDPMSLLELLGKR
jgi:murein DD-endopeptidase MepM/ murein hydrolase activator NlpD